MSIWRTTPVSQTPCIELGSWIVYETETGEHHFVGRNLTEGSGRVSSSIQSYDPETKIGTTNSGRKYQLIGDSGIDGDALYVWDHWKDINGVVTFKDVSSQY